MAAFTCPGRCGFVVEDQHAKSCLTVHLSACEPGLAALEQLRQFGLWLLEHLGTAFDVRMLPHPYCQEGVVDWSALSRMFVKQFVGVD